MTELSETDLDNRARKVYEKALDRLEDVDMSISKMQSLIERQRESSEYNPDCVHGTYLDKREPHRGCVFDLCDGTRGAKIADHDGNVTSTFIQCPCVNPKKLKNYQDGKRVEFEDEMRGVQ